MAAGTAGFEDELGKQADACRRSSPLYGRLMEALLGLWKSPDEGAALRRVLEAEWGNRAFHAWYERPLLLAMVLHAMALESRGDHPLAEVFPSCGGSGGPLERERVWDAIRLLEGSEPRRAWLRSKSVQTNDTSRAIGWIWPLAVLAPRLPGRMALFDLGTSAGLNLIGDRLGRGWTDGEGRPLKVAPLPELVARIGFDREPLDARDPECVLRLRASVWADDRARLERLEQALAMAAGLAEEGRFTLERAELREMPAAVTARARELGAPVALFQSYVTDYLPTAAREDFERRMLAAVTAMPAGSLWIELESARSHVGTYGGAPALAELRVHLGLGGIVAHECVARAAPHPKSLEVDLDAMRRLWDQLG